MIRTRLFLVLGALLFAGCTFSEDSPADFVDVFIGTGEHGHTHPSATFPFGMIQPGPVNGTPGWDWSSGYHYSDSVISGFTQTHLSGTGIGDLNDILVMPVPGTFSFDDSSRYPGKRSYASSFSHEKEFAEAGYYRVHLPDTDITTEITTTERVALYRFTFPENTEPAIVLDPGFSLNWDTSKDALIGSILPTVISGYRFSSGWAKEQRVFFALQFSENVDDLELFADRTAVDSLQVRNPKARALIRFSETGTRVLLMKIAISGVSIEGALNNLLTVSDFDFDATAMAAKAEWNRNLRMFEIDGSEKEKRIFYTALYHSLQAPHLFSDVDGNYRGGDGNTYHDGGRPQYTIFSLWDTFRAQHPLLTLIRPDKVDGMMQSMVRFYEQHGLLPVWELHGNETNTMTGYHAIPVLTEAYVKGFRGFDSEKAMEGMLASAGQQQRGSDLYRKYGYIPSELEPESVTKTLEYAYDDYAISVMAKALGKAEIAAEFEKRAEYWRNVYDVSTGFMRGKTSDGKWVSPFDPRHASHRQNTDYTEGNAWQHSWFVPHNIPGLIEIMGGNEAFVEKLDSLFSIDSEITGDNVSPDISGLIGQYAHGNEPSHHIAYMYNFAGHPEKTRERIHHIKNVMYDDTPEGVSGNEDVGQMSAWYVFSALGFYPLDPVSTRYELGIPTFKRVDWKLPNGAVFRILNTLDPANPTVVQEILLNGEKLKRTYITHFEILNGGTLEFR